MAPKKKFTKEQLVAAAFEIALTEGVEQITIRKVAERTGSSIAPIYVNFADVDQLKHEVVRKIYEVSQQMLMTCYSPDPFLNIGIASIKFARQYPVLFNELLTLRGQGRYLDAVQVPPHDMLREMKRAPELEGLPEEELMTIMFKLQVFQMGLSVMDVNQLLPEHCDEEQLIGMLASTGKDLIMAAHHRLREREASDKESKREE